MSEYGYCCAKRGDVLPADVRLRCGDSFWEGVPDRYVTSCCGTCYYYDPYNHAIPCPESHGAHPTVPRRLEDGDPSASSGLRYCPICDEAWDEEFIRGYEAGRKEATDD